MREKIIKLFESNIAEDIVLGKILLLKTYPEIRNCISNVNWGGEAYKYHLYMTDVERILGYTFERAVNVGGVGLIFTEEEILYG